MMIFRHPVWSRLGATVGILAVLALALAAPIHHVHAIERDLAGTEHAGHPGQAAAHMGAAHGGHGDHAQHGVPAKPEAATVHCPLCTLGKMAGVLLPPDLTTIHVPGVAPELPFPVEAIAAASSQLREIPQPRGPPARA